ncbi:MAG: 3-isopropylmalate dehydratase large subunit [Chloroflexota bacterium]|jgi:3-isopropylmalate/(R)-2-methylmalate dehydratase large subunit|nr:3-isopropylmalate dehydratase large subunit [Chloroflexota bacterium]
MQRTLFEKIWDAHVVTQEPGSPAVLYIDLHLVHEVTSPQAFEGLRKRGIKVRRPDRTFATLDHGIPTYSRDLPIIDQMAAKQIAMMEQNAEDNGIMLYGMKTGADKQGIVHVIGPELGLTQPGKTIVCGDSHTATHGAFGALGFGIGTSEVEMVLSTQCLLQRKPKTANVKISGTLQKGVTAKDIILGIIAKYGVGGGTGYVFEYTGEAIRKMNMEERMTVCNMSIEGGSRAGMIAPDDTTFEYLAGREFSPKGAAWDKAVAQWRTLPSDEGATYDTIFELDADTLAPMITYGTNPGMGMHITERVPDPADIGDLSQRNALSKALNYMGLNAGETLLGKPIDVVFIGSCTNSRMSDLRQAADLIKGRKVSDKVRVMVVPGSAPIKKQAEREGLHEIFLAAGAEWREPGCSMCIAMNGDELSAGQYAVSTSNRNFEGRQGKGGRTFLASPLTAVASAITGVVTDARTLA